MPEEYFIPPTFAAELTYNGELSFKSIPLSEEVMAIYSEVLPEGSKAETITSVIMGIDISDNTFLKIRDRLDDINTNPKFGEVCCTTKDNGKPDITLAIGKTKCLVKLNRIEAETLWNRVNTTLMIETGMELKDIPKKVIRLVPQERTKKRSTSHHWGFESQAER